LIELSLLLEHWRCHCEERGDEAIQGKNRNRRAFAPWIASLRSQ
jgi:hypothetical protein